MSHGLLTTAVGSYPKPDYIVKARAQVSRGKMDPSELQELEKKATAHWIKLQEDVGLDILVDGEMYRGDMVTYFSENLDGFSISGLVRSYGNRYYRKPIAVAPVRRKSPITLEWWKYASSLTDRPIKGMLTGPYTIADWSFNEYYDTFEDLVLALAEVVNQEALDLQQAGAPYIQIDDPAVSTRPEEMELASRSLGIAARGLSVPVLTHICYGDFAAVFDQLVRLPVTIIDVETANRDYEMLELFRAHSLPVDKSVSLGVTDVHSHVVESVEEIKRGVKRGLETFPPERLLIAPDCGLKTRTEEEAVGKLRNMVLAVQEVRDELGIERVF